MADGCSSRRRALARCKREIRPAQKRPVRVMHFHGTADRSASFTGGRGERSLSSITFYSVERTINTRVAADGCAPTPRIR